MSTFRKVLTDPRLMIVFLMGFSSGLPLLLVGATLKSWMTVAGLSLATIGSTSFVKLPYSWKVLWSPIVDRYTFPRLGRRRGWLLLFQVGVMASLLLFTQLDPGAELPLVLAAAMTVAFFSASQDIVVDAYRREFLPDEEMGLGSSLYTLGYYIGMYMASSVALILADHIPWTMVYAVMAALMLVGILTTLYCPEPKVDLPPPKSIRESVAGPIVDFFRRDGAWTIFLFVLLYKVGEAMASDMLNPFYLKTGFTLTEVGAIGKTFGIWTRILGGIVGGVLMIKLKLYRSLWTFGILQSLGILLFSVLAVVGHKVWLLAVAVSAESLTSGMATTAFVTFNALQTNKRFTSVQLSLLTSLAVFPQVLLGVPSGILADMVGWKLYFIVCTVATIPGLLMLFPIRRIIESAEPESA